MGVLANYGCRHIIRVDAGHAGDNLGAFPRSLSIKRAQKNIKLGLMLALFSTKKWQMQTRESTTFCLNQPLYAVISHTINFTRAKARSLSHQIAFCTVAALIMLNRGVPGGALHVFTGYSGIGEALPRLSNSRHDSHTLPLYCYKCTTCLHQTVPPPHPPIPFD